MKYIKSTLQFLFVLDKGRRFLSLFLMILPTALIVSFVFPLDIYIKWVATYDAHYDTLLALWTSLQPASMTIGTFLLALFAIVISYSAYNTLTLRCFRVGVFTVKGFLRSANENFFPAFYLVASLIIFYVFWQFILVLFLYLLQLSSSIAFIRLMSIILMIIWSVGLVFALLPFVVWLPLMAINGFGPTKAFGLALQKASTRTIPIALSLGFLIAVIIGINFLSGFLAISFLSTIVNTISFAFAFCYVSVLSMIVYFDIEALTREDISRSLYFSR